MQKNSEILLILEAGGGGKTMIFNHSFGNSMHTESHFYTAAQNSESLPFVLISYGHFLCDSNYFTERDNMDACLLICTLAGCGTMRYADTEASLTPGTAVAIDCRRYQYYQTGGEAPWDFLWMHFTGRCAAGLCDRLNGGGLRVLPYGIPVAQQAFRELASLASHFGVQSDFQLSLHLHTMLTELAAAAFPAGGGDRYAGEMRRAAAFIREHYARPLRVDDMAQQCSLSRYHFIRMFHRFTGQTPYEYLTICRINSAKKLLSYTDKSVAQIAAEVGYSDAKVFIGSFKKRVGVTPLQFRNNSMSP